MKKTLQIVSLICVLLLFFGCRNQQNSQNVETISTPVHMTDTIVQKESSVPVESSDESTKRIIGKWTICESSIFVIYEKEGKYYADNIDNGNWLNDPYELRKSVIDGRVFYMPVVTDEWSECYEIKKDGLYTKYLTKAGGQLFPKAE